MALTNDRPKETMETLRFLMELSRGFRLFEQYGLEKLVKDAHALSESEMAKAKEAKDNISRYESLIAEQKNRQQEIDGAASENSERSKQLSDEWKKLGKEASELKQWQNDVNKQVEELKQSKAQLLERERTIEVKESKIAESRAKVESDQKEAGKILSELKARADKMKGLAEGL